MDLVLTILFVLLLVLGVCLWLDMRTPRTVAWRSAVHGGMHGSVADGLVLQHDDGTTVWATRGYSIYRSFNGGAFHRVARVRAPLGEAWGGNLRTLRRLFGYQELVEVVPLTGDRLVVFAGGWVHRIDLSTRRSTRTHQLRYFGRGKGRGLMAFGVTQDLSGALYFAEYVTESGDRPTGIWKSDNQGASWSLCFEFEPGTVRHIHTVQCDPYDGAIWIGTGDRDEHCFVGASRDGGATFEWVGHGAQRHRTCAFAFYADAVLWGMDADFEQNHLVRWQRSDGEITLGARLPDATYYASRIGDELLLGLAQGVAEVWIGRDDGSARRWTGWRVPTAPPKRGPSPGVRLARGDCRTGSRIHLNPLRTIEHEAAIWRFERSELPTA